MQAELISIGDELLIGQTINSNAAFIGQCLTEIGIPVHWTTVVGDNRDAIRDVLDIAVSRADVLIVTGGLGPTHDDVTRSVFVDYFNTSLVLDEAVLRNIELLFEKRNRKMPPSNRDQAMIPKSAVKIDNEFGTAPGFRFERDNKHFIVLPGVPLEMRTMMEKTVVPFLKGKANHFIKYKMFKTTGISESALFELMGDIDELERDVKIAFLPKPTGVEIRVTAEDETEKECLKRLKKAEKIIVSRIQEHIWGFDDDKLEEVVTRLLAQQQKTVGLVEGSTGGLISHRLTNSPQMTQFLKATLVLNHADAMIDHLHLNAELIAEHGLQSSEVAIAMAESVRNITNTDIGIATTPFKFSHASSTEEQVVVAVAASKGVMHETVFVNRDMHFNKERPAQLALDILRRLLMH